jgi:hypothetical protein
LEQQSAHVDEDVPLASLDLFFRVEAPVGCDLGGLGALAVDDAERRSRLPSFGRARRRARSVEE